MSRDHLLKKAITDELQRSTDVISARIGVGVTDGTVTLSGQVRSYVRSYVEKTAAVDAGLRVQGVTGVADDIVVQHHSGSQEDADVARDVTATLRASAALSHETIRATVRDHRVSLFGTVSCQQQRDTAEKLVSGLPGVALVVNNLAVTPRIAHGHVVS